MHLTDVMNLMHLTELHTGQLSRALNASDCHKIWRAPLQSCCDAQNDDIDKAYQLFRRFRAESRAFYEVSSVTLSRCHGTTYLSTTHNKKIKDQ